MSGPVHGLVGVRVTAALSAVAAVAVTLAVGWGSPAWWLAPLLAMAVAGAELAVVSLQFGRQRWQFSLTEAALAAALVAATGAWVVLPVALGALAAQQLRGVPRLKIVFNTAMFAVSASAAAAVSTALGGGNTGAVAGLAAFFVLNHVLVGFAVALTSACGVLSVVVTSAPLSALHTAGNSSLGLLAAYLLVEAPVGLLGLAVPLALLWSAYAQQTRRSAEARLFSELAHGSEQVQGRSTDTSATVVLGAAARLLGADVELLLRAPEGTVRYSGDEKGVHLRTQVGTEAFDAPEVVRALGARGVSTHPGPRPTCAVALGAPDAGAAPLAVLLARREDGGRPFSRSDLQLVQVLAGQAEAWLSIADLSARHRRASDEVDEAGESARALGDVGAGTLPALALLRDSAERLARIGSGGELAEVVEELQLVERAVASLLGAVALAAEPDLRRSAPALDGAPARPATEWTSTGVLA